MKASSVAEGAEDLEASLRGAVSCDLSAARSLCSGFFGEIPVPGAVEVVAEAPVSEPTFAKLGDVPDEVGVVEEVGARVAALAGSCTGGTAPGEVDAAFAEMVLGELVFG